MFNLRLRNQEAALLQNHLPFSPRLAFPLFFDQSTEGHSFITVYGYFRSTTQHSGSDQMPEKTKPPAGHEGELI